MQQECNSKVEKLLTKEQQEKWKTMQGEKFTLKEEPVGKKAK